MAKIRESNMELLRIVAMFFVMILHADFAALGQPNQEVCLSEPGVTLFRYICEALSIVCVNVFVLISGWFGIRPSLKGFMKFLVQVLYFSLLTFVVSGAVGRTVFSVTELFTSLLFTHPLYWFIPAYIGLYILAPVLNAFVQHAEQRSYTIVLITWYVFQTIYGLLWCGDGAFNFGYSLLSFIGLYLLAQYVKHYGMTWVNRPWYVHLSIYVVLCIIVCALGYIGARYDVDGMQTKSLAYDNPLVVIASLELLLCFVNFHFKSKVVNFIAASSFSVFLLHLSPWFYFDCFKAPIQQIAAASTPFMATIQIFVFLMGIYAAALLLDQVRALLWLPLEKALSRDRK